MTIVVDISCPSCGLSDPVRKEQLDTYRCSNCGHVFSPEDVVD